MVCGTPTDSPDTTSYINAWYVRSFGDLGYDDYVVYGISYGLLSAHEWFVTVMVCDYTHLASFIITTTSLVPTANIPFACILYR